MDTGKDQLENKRGSTSPTWGRCRNPLNLMYSLVMITFSAAITDTMNERTYHTCQINCL